jgi:DNA-binding NtrC family response regulator
MSLECLPSRGMEIESKQGWVLVVIREQRLRQLLLMVLSQAGYALVGCSTLAEAEQIVRKHCPPKLILFDGAAASEAGLREQIQQMEGALPPEANCQVIVFSLAHPQPRLQELPGVAVLIARPFDLTQVLDKVEALMQG